MELDIIPKRNKQPDASENIIKVIGVGGAGGNAVNNMVKKGIYKVDYYLVNTDSQDFEKSPIPKENKIQIGKTLTEGLGAGNDPQYGKAAAKESIEELKSIFDKNTKMVFITAGMGGGTGTGAAPIVAKLAKEREILTVAIVTIPAQIEGQTRVTNARLGLEELKKHVDSVIIINNSKINKLYRDLEVTNAWEKADDILAIAVKGIAEIITVKGYVNVDFADVRSVLKDSGVALMSLGEGEGEQRAAYALANAIDSPLLNNNKIEGAKNVLLHLSASRENMIKMGELDNILKAVQHLTNKTNIIYGVSENNELGDKIRLTLIATGFPEKEAIFEDDSSTYVDGGFWEVIRKTTNKRNAGNTGIGSDADDDIKPMVDASGNIKTDVTIEDIKNEISNEDDDYPEPEKEGNENMPNHDMGGRIIDSDGEITDSPYFDRNVD